jgi:hypothetical protein
VVCERQWKEGSENGASVCMGTLLGERGGVKEGSGNGHLFKWGPRWKTWKRAHLPGAYKWKKVQGRVSLPTGAPLGNLGRGVCLVGTLRIS